MTHAQILDYVRNNPGMTPRQLRHKVWRLKIPIESFRAALQELNGELPKTIPGLPPASSVPAPKLAARTAPIAELIEQFDDVKRARDAVQAMPRDHYIADEDLRRRLHVSPDRWRSLVQHPDVSAYRYKLPNGRMVWMHPAAQEKLNARIRME
jgi:hypothetical protein